MRIDPTGKSPQIGFPGKDPDPDPDPDVLQLTGALTPTDRAELEVAKRAVPTLIKRQALAGVAERHELQFRQVVEALEALSSDAESRAELVTLQQNYEIVNLQRGVAGSSLSVHILPFDLPGRHVEGIGFTNYGLLDAYVASAANRLGAATPDQKGRYVAQARELNPELFVPEKAGKHRYIVLPAYQYVADPGTGKVLCLSSEDAACAQQWEQRRETRYHGQGLYAHDYRAIFLREGILGYFLNGNNASVHEARHGVEDAAKIINPDYYATYRNNKLAAFQHAKAVGRRGFITPYAARDEGPEKIEFGAENLAACFSGYNQPILRALDRAGYENVKEFLHWRGEQVQ